MYARKKLYKYVYNFMFVYNYAIIIYK